MKKSPIPLSILEKMFTLSPAQVAELYNRHLLYSQHVSKLQCTVRDKRLQRALTYIRENSMDNIKLRTVADLVGMSVEGLKKLFERKCHKCFKTILIEFRIAAAKELLLSDAYSHIWRANIEVNLLQSILHQQPWQCLRLSGGENFRFPTTL
jgi:AraC-like DNA-binding protein